MAMATTPATYPVDLPIDRPSSVNVFWAVPLVGLIAKLIILIPHFIVLGLLRAAVSLAHLVIWVPVLFTGHYPDWGFALTAGWIRWEVRVGLYIYGITDLYPAFSFEAPGDVTIAVPESSSRFWAIPLIGSTIKALIVIPHLLILAVLGFVVALTQLVVWVPVLFGGNFPAWAFDLIHGLLLWQARLYAYLFGLTDRYPPFSMSSPERPAFSTSEPAVPLSA
jgi:hypothetical protein